MRFIFTAVKIYFTAFSSLRNLEKAQISSTTSLRGEGEAIYKKNNVGFMDLHQRRISTSCVCQEAKASRNDRGESITTSCNDKDIKTKGRSILEEKSGLCEATRESYLEGNDRSGAEALRDFNLKDKPLISDLQSYTSQQALILQRQIDELVHALYNLNESEIQIIESI